MPYFFVFLFELFLLAALTSHSSSYFLRFFQAVTGSQKASIILFSLLFFPGTFIHEFSHWLMAKLLFVYVGQMEFLPQIQGDAIKLGSVSIIKTDPLRRILIGVAPVIFGLTILLSLLWGIRRNYTFLTSYPWWIWLALGYVVLVVGSTMFSSRKDLEGSLGVIVAAVILVVISDLIGFDWVLWSAYQYLVINLNDFFKQLSVLLLIPIGVNTLITLMGWSATKRM